MYRHRLASLLGPTLLTTVLNNDHRLNGVTLRVADDLAIERSHPDVMAARKTLLVDTPAPTAKQLVTAITRDMEREVAPIVTYGSEISPRNQRRLAKKKAAKAVR